MSDEFETVRLQVPEEISKECFHEQDRIGLPDAVPAFAEMKDGRRTLFKRWGELSVGDLEQVVERHKRLGIKAIQRFVEDGNRPSLRKAAYHIVRARIFRGRYLELTGFTDWDNAEKEMPFTCHSE